MSSTAQALGDRETLGRQGVEAWGKGKHSITVALGGGEPNKRRSGEDPESYDS